MRLAFPDASVDVVVAPYVMTVVPEPGRTLDEFARVVKPGGEIVLVNHIGAQFGMRARIEGWLARRSASLGWRPEFPWSVIGDWIDGTAVSNSSNGANSPGLPVHPRAHPPPRRAPGSGAVAHAEMPAQP